MKQYNTALKITEESGDHSHTYQRERFTNMEADLHSIPFNYCEASDEALVGLYVNSRSEEAYNEIASRYSEIIIGFATKLCRNVHDAQDIKQDVLLILATKLHTFKGNSKFSTWLYRVTLNTCYKYLADSNKKTVREIKLEDSSLNQFSSESLWAMRPDEIILNQEKMNIISRAVDELNESNKKIFNLKDIKGFSNAEVGNFMGLSISAVKSRILRTRLSLRSKISVYF